MRGNNNYKGKKSNKKNDNMREAVILMTSREHITLSVYVVQVFQLHCDGHGYIAKVSMRRFSCHNDFPVIPRPCCNSTICYTHILWACLATSCNS